MDDADEGKTQTRSYWVNIQRCFKHHVEYQGSVKVDAISEEDAEEIAEQMIERNEIDWHEVGTYDREQIEGDHIEVELDDEDDYQEDD